MLTPDTVARHVGEISGHKYQFDMMTFFGTIGLAKSDFDLLVRFYLKHFLTCQYDINRVNS
jgi:hypothetical protein